MAVVPNIFRSWRQPRVVMRALLAGGPREDWALATLMAACLVVFVSLWPAQARLAHLDAALPEAQRIPLEARIAGAAFGAIFIGPLLAYTLAALSHIVARAFGGRGTGFRVRMALFWSMLAVSPAVLLQGLVAGFIGPGPALNLVGLALGVGFLAIWGASLRVAEFEAP
ncbi:MAG: YIP1 family protein [Phaeovulum sp.]|uniref:YIP1 family protein n=1 Tax=Phaeovulum sp. TaxID=2934796 RepID=UPI00273035C6|nr:YIP1 family protein [Phaeovulum sp.]MDP2063254.1 YIP1 family protein [Phaeovulum sp.]